MEFSSRNTQRSAAAHPTQAPTSPSGTVSTPSTSTPQKKRSSNSGIKILGTVLFISAVFLATTAIASISMRSNETALVSKDNYQVVALVDKQAYFGKIKKITDNYIVLQDVYYIQGSTGQNDTNDENTTLVKRGCEIHRPQDQMTIYREQINFWENVQGDSKVAEAIKQFKEENPDGQDCNKQTAQPSTQQNTTEPATTEPTATTDSEQAPETDTSEDN